MAKRIVLTNDELDALISIGGDVDAHATVESAYEPDEREIAIAAWESGMDKLRAMYARRRGTSHV